MTSWFVGSALLALVALGDAAMLFSQLAINARPPNAEDKGPSPPPDEWFTQYLDHFNITDNRQWKQRYQAIKDHYKKDGPVFLLLGGEWWASGDYLHSYSVVTYAKKFNAMVFQLEHRFYGESRPTKDVSTENLHYLSADQALADTAYFIKGMNEKHELPPSTKWVVFGASYSANLAAWMRDKYSHLVYAAVADSGPILAKVNFYDYINVVRETLARCSPACVDAIQEAHVKVKELLKTTEGQNIVHKKFILCEPIDVTNKKDVYNMLACLSDNFSGVVQFNGTYNTTVNKVCDIMLNKSLGDIIERYAEVNALVEKDEGNNCTGYKYDEGIEEMKNTSWDAKCVVMSNRQWYYQTCTEFGYYQTSTDKKHLFYNDIPLELYLDQCSDIYGKEFSKDVIYKGKNRTNTVYGGLNGQATRVVYIYSQGDPWSALGNTKTVLAESPVIYVKGASHCSVTSDIKDTDSPAVKEAWHQVQDLVGKWCAE